MSSSSLWYCTYLVIAIRGVDVICTHDALCRYLGLTFYVSRRLHYCRELGLFFQLNWYTERTQDNYYQNRSRFRSKCFSVSVQRANSYRPKMLHGNKCSIMRVLRKKNELLYHYKLKDQPLATTSNSKYLYIR